MEKDDERLQELIEIEELAIKIEELAKGLRKIKYHLNEGTKSIVNKTQIAEKQIKENPLVYIMGAFIGGIILGSYVLRRRKLH